MRINVNGSARKNVGTVGKSVADLDRLYKRGALLTSHLSVSPEQPGSVSPDGYSYARIKGSAG